MKLLDDLHEAVRSARGLDCDLVATTTTGGLTRFANSEVHQNVVESSRAVYARVARGKSVGVASTNALDGASLSRAIEQAADTAGNVPENPEFAGLPKPRSLPQVRSFDDAVLGLTPSRRVSALARVFRAADAHRFTVAGGFGASSGETAVASSTGVAAWTRWTRTYANVIAMKDDERASGYAASSSWRADGVDVESLSGIAINKCRWSREPEEIEPGEYDVLFEPPAVASLLTSIAFIGFGSRPFLDGESFMCDRIGERVMHGSVTILDDPFERFGSPTSFDYEGMPRVRTVLIDRGVARGVVHSSHTAAKVGVADTGNAWPGDSGSFGGWPRNLAMEGGDVPRAKMLERLGAGLLVTRLHYLNNRIDTRNAVVTGMTRDGTYWVEGGKVKRAVKNLRFTEKMLSAFSRVDGVSRERWNALAGWAGASTLVAPSVIVRGFTFTGKSDH